MTIALNGWVTSVRNSAEPPVDPGAEPIEYPGTGVGTEGKRNGIHRGSKQ